MIYHHWPTFTYFANHAQWIWNLDILSNKIKLILNFLLKYSSKLQINCFFLSLRWKNTPCIHLIYLSLIILLSVWSLILFGTTSPYIITLVRWNSRPPQLQYCTRLLLDIKNDDLKMLRTWLTSSSLLCSTTSSSEHIVIMFSSSLLFFTLRSLG